MAARVLQFFHSQVLPALEDKSVEAIKAGKKNSTPMVLKAAVSGIVPQPVRDRNYRGSIEGLLEVQAPREYEGFIVPAGSKLEWSVGERGEEVAGGSIFMAVDEEDLVELGTGNSAALAAKFQAWVAAQG